MKRTGTKIARELRRSMTDAEKRIWQIVRDRHLDGAKFRRQWPVGLYVVDFVCLEAKLVLEIDGGQHADNAADALRTCALQHLGFRVLRFWNNDVLTNPEGVAAVISDALRPRSPSG